MAQSINHPAVFLSRFGVWGDKPQASNRGRLSLQACLLPLILLIGCTSESGPSGASAGGSDPSSGNHPPVIQRATVLPNPILLNGPVSVQIEAEDPDRNPLTFRHQWFINGNRVEGETRPTLAPSFLKRGDRVQAEVVASDGQVEGKPFQAAAVVVGNTPPEATKIAIEPTGSDRTRFHAVVESVDVDRDAVTYVFRWRRNTTIVLEGEQSTLDTGSFTRGDSLTVEVTPHDASGAGKPRLSEPIALGNNAPTITSQPPASFGKDMLSYAVQAVDEDKDTLKYQLESAPPGMTIDPATGVITWQVGSNVKGKYRVRVAVQDGQGGSAFQDFEISLVSPSPAS